MSTSVTWEKGEREPVGSIDPKTKRFMPRLGKNQGPVFKQHVVKIITHR